MIADHEADGNDMRDSNQNTTRPGGERRDVGIDPGELRATVARLLDDARTSLTARLRPAAKRSPLRVVSQAAAVGFVLGIIVPVRLQMLVLAPAIRTGVRRVIAASHTPPAGGNPRGATSRRPPRAAPGQG